MSVRQLRAIETDVTGCRACPRLVAWRERGQGQGRSLRRSGVLGAAGARVRRPGGARAHRGPGAGRPRREPDGPHLHRRPVRRLPLSRRCSVPASRTSPPRLARRRARAPGAFVSAVSRCAPPGNKPTPEERDRCLPFLAREIAAAGRLRVDRGARGVRVGRALRALRADGVPCPAPAAVRPWRRTRRSGRTAARLLPPEPAEHVHGQAHPGHAATRSSSGRWCWPGRLSHPRVRRFRDPGRGSHGPSSGRPVRRRVPWPHGSTPQLLAVVPGPGSAADRPQDGSAGRGHLQALSGQGRRGRHWPSSSPRGWASSTRC